MSSSLPTHTTYNEKALRHLARLLARQAAREHLTDLELDQNKTAPDTTITDTDISHAP